MTSSRREAEVMKEALKLSWQPELKSPSLVVGWSTDANSLGAKVTDYLIGRLGGQSFCEIEPVQFFSLGGVAIDNNLVQFPESKFYACPKNDLVVFKSTPPSHEWYRFLNLILDVAEHYCRVKEIYTMGGLVSLGPHTAPREMLSTCNSPGMKESLSLYPLTRDWDFETPPGQRPTLNAFLLWVAKSRSIPGVNMMVPIPFYLMAVADPRAQKRVLDLLNQKLTLGMDFNDLDEEIRQQNQLIAEARDSFPDIDEYIGRLESNLRLSAEENQRLVREIEKFLREKRV